MSINIDFASVFSEEELNQLAKDTGFVQRQSVITGFNFALTFTTGLISNPGCTLNQLAGFFGNISGVNVSPQAIDDRLDETAREFLKQCLAKAMQLTMQKIDIDNELIKCFAHIYIIDSTNFDLHKSLKNLFKGSGGGASVAAMRIQFLFDYLSGQIYLEIGDARTSDATTLFDIVKTNKLETDGGCLFLQDLGYFKTETFLLIDHSFNLFISKLRFRMNIYDTNGDEIDLSGLLKKQPAKIDMLIKIGDLSCRLVGCKLPDNIVNQRRRKANAAASKKRGKAISKDYKLFLSYGLFITNLSEEYTPDSIFIIYKLRWQVELIFKSWKSVLGIHKIHTAKESRVLCEVYGKLIIAVITQRLYVQLMHYEHEVLSLHKVFQYLKSIALILAQHIMAGTNKSELFYISLSTQIIRYCRKNSQKNKPIIEQRLMALIPLKSGCRA